MCFLSCKLDLCPMAYLFLHIFIYPLYNFRREMLSNYVMNRYLRLEMKCIETNLKSNISK